MPRCCLSSVGCKTLALPTILIQQVKGNCGCWQYSSRTHSYPRNLTPPAAFTDHFAAPQSAARVFKVDHFITRARDESKQYRLYTEWTKSIQYESNTFTDKIGATYFSLLLHFNGIDAYYVSHWGLILRQDFLIIKIITKILTRWRSWLRHWATSRTVAGSIPDGITDLILLAFL
jgi:hypothetical protein